MLSKRKSSYKRSVDENKAIFFFYYLYIEGLDGAGGQEGLEFSNR